jgi:putative addiction module component (TIGR02574 family)
MEPEQITKEISRMSLAQKLLLTQDIWDSIAREGDRLPMPQWQKKELDKRYDEYRQGTMDLHDWQDIHNRLRAGHK